MDTLLVVSIVLAVAVTILILVLYLGLKVRLGFRRVHARIDRLQRGLDKLPAHVSREAQQVQDVVCLTQLGLRFPVFLGGWSIDAFLAKRLVQLLVETRPRTVLELGSGTSTILIAQCMRLQGMLDYEHIAIDHDPRFLALTRELAKLNGLEDYVRFCECPLQQMNGFDHPWYSGVQEILRDRKIDLLLIDGPPGFLHEKARHPALPVLLPFLNDDCTVIIDDAVRAGEKSLAQQWVQEMPAFTLDFVGGSHNAAVLTRSGQLRAPSCSRR